MDIQDLHLIRHWSMFEYIRHRQSDDEWRGSVRAVETFIEQAIDRLEVQSVG